MESRAAELGFSEEEKEKRRNNGLEAGGVIANRWCKVHFKKKRRRHRKRIN
jgi:hypothetical protein